MENMKNIKKKSTVIPVQKHYTVRVYMGTVLKLHAFITSVKCWWLVRFMLQLLHPCRNRLVSADVETENKS